MALTAAAAGVNVRVLAAAADVCRARLRLESADNEITDEARLADGVSIPREGYFAALERYFYTAERAAGRDPARDADD
jgi:hypothetical protein